MDQFILSSVTLLPARSADAADLPMLAKPDGGLCISSVSPSPCAPLSCQFPSLPGLALTTAALILTFHYLSALFYQAAESFLDIQGQVGLLKSTVGLRSPGYWVWPGSLCFLTHSAHVC